MINPIDKVKYPNVYAGFDYALDVVMGEIPNSVYVIGACERFLRDFVNVEIPGHALAKYYFDCDRAETYLRKVQNFEHVIGDWTTIDNPGNKILYEPWQCFIWMNIVGFRDRFKPRNPRFRVAHIEVPRGNAKSAMASQAALYYVGMDTPLKGNQISCFATKSDQARIVLDSSQAMANKATNYLKATGVEVLAHKIVHRSSNSFIRAMAADSNGLDGLNDILAIMDELHAMDQKLFDVVYSGMSKRRDSLMLCITTAGFNNDSVGYFRSLYAKRLCKGEFMDDQLFAIVYTIDEGDDLFEELTWKKANPNYGKSVDPLTFAAKYNAARETPSELPNFKVKHLNVWVSEANAFFDTAAWDKCADPSSKIESFFGDKCYAGIDLASKVDITSFAYVFRRDGKFYIFDKSYIPEDAITKAKLPLYQNCVASGHLIATPGEAIHYPKLREEFIDMSKKVKIISAQYDPWNALSFAQECSDDRIDMIEFRMNVANLSEPTKNLDALIRQGKIVHNGSPLLKWCLGNVVCKEDNAGNVFPKKTTNNLKIDPIIAIIMAIAMWMNEKEESSVYESRGVTFL